MVYIAVDALLSALESLDDVTSPEEDTMSDQCADL